MTSLLLRTLSQTLQAFLPVAVALTWLSRRNDRAKERAVRFGLLAAVVLTPVAGTLFQQMSRQSQLEAGLAWTIATLAAVALLAAWRAPVISTTEPRAPPRLVLLLIAGAALLAVVRQTMEIATVLRVALVDLKSMEAAGATIGGFGLGVAVAYFYWRAGRSVAAPVLHAAVRTFGVLFIAQAALYAFHESAESGWLPWSEALHAATEPYGPDGRYGPLGSGLVASLPVLAAIAAARARPRAATAWRRWVIPVAVALGVVSMAAVAYAVYSSSRDRLITDGSPETLPGVAPANAAPGTLLYRRTNIQRGYGLLTVAAADPPGATAVSTSLVCARVAFGGGQGICLQANRGLFTSYRAVLFDRTLTPSRTLSIEGSPTRARVSADGRVGAFTVFDSNVHTYAATTFSTLTTLIDMTTGDRLGNLEQFSTWQNGVRIRAADFNFWGVTFASDPNTFYATLRTAGKTYLVRGELGLRKLTVMRENAECPSLSPDGRRLAFKKRVGPETAPWRIYVVDLASMAEHEVAGETRSIDDQIEWLDDQHLLYGVPRGSGTPTVDVWTAPVDGGPARLFLPEAESPVVVR
jgi:hypothetical protein